MNKINRFLVLLLAPVFVFLVASCPAPSSEAASSTWMDNNTGVLQATAPTPPVAVKAWPYCPNTKLTITFSGDFGAVKTLEIYQSGTTGAYTKIATYTGLPGTVVYYNTKLPNGQYRFYVKALRSKNNVWYTSGTYHYTIYCSSGPSSASSGVY